MTHHTSLQPRFRPRTLAAIGICAIFIGTGGCEERSIEGHMDRKGTEGIPESAAQVPAAPPPEEDSSAPSPPSLTPSAEQGQRWPWSVPEGWAEDPQPRQMRLATYIADDPEGPIEVAITRFAGRVGGDLANINRWRGQMGLEPIDETGLDEVLTRFSAPGFDGYLTRIESAGGVMLAAGIYEAGIDQTWFVRSTVQNPDIADRLQDALFGLARSIANDRSEGDR